MDDTDFARLFRLDGVGQVLVTVDENEEEEAPCLTFRLGDVGGFGTTLRLTSRYKDEPDDDEAYRRTRAAMQALDEDKVRDILKTAIDFRQSLIDKSST